MKKHHLVALAAFFYAGLVHAGQIEGKAMYRERIALPPGAMFEASLLDVSRADAAAKVLGVARIKPAGNPPFAFKIKYDDKDIVASNRYSLQAKITLNGKLLFITDSTNSVLNGAPALTQPLMMQSVAENSSSSPTELPSAVWPLLGTYWKLTQIGQQAFVMKDEQHEPHIVLGVKKRHVSGSGGCNRLMGSYKLKRHSLEFTKMATTMMSCHQGGEVEHAFTTQLAKVKRYAIEGDVLQLFDAKGRTILQLQATVMH